MTSLMNKNKPELCYTTMAYDTWHSAAHKAIAPSAYFIFVFESLYFSQISACSKSDTDKLFKTCSKIHDKTYLVERSQSMDLLVCNKW